MFARAGIVALALLVGAGKTHAVDLFQIQRSILKEPNYQTKSPRYCLLVFGPEANTRVWLVVDGNTLYIDRNGDGDLTGPDEKVVSQGSFHCGNIQEKGGGPIHKDLYLWKESGDSWRMGITSQRLGRQAVGFQGEVKPCFSARAETAPIIHFDGPLELATFAQVRDLPRNPDGRSYRETSLRVKLGTPGLGKGTFAACNYRCTQDWGPLRAEFEYAGLSGQTIKERVDLKTFN